MQHPQMGGEISGARIARLQEEARWDRQVRLARRHRRAFRPAGTWRRVVGTRLVEAGVRLLDPNAEARRSVEMK
jgi:ribosomal protein L19E